MTQPTKNRIPSGNILDQVFNAEKIDEVVNSDDLEYTDRFGKKRFTFNGIYLALKGYFDTLKSNLSSDEGYKEIGGFFSAEGPEQIGYQKYSIFDRVFKRGMYEIDQGPGDPKGIAGITFGGENNKGTILLDERGRIQTYSVKENVITAARVAVPYGELFGQGPNASNYDGHIVHFPFPGGEDDSLHSSLVFIPNQLGGSDVWVRGPGAYGNYDVPYPNAKKVMSKLAKVNDLPPAILKSSTNYSSFVSSVSWSLLFVLRTDTVGPIFTGVYISGNVLSNAVYSYLIEVNNVGTLAPTTATAKDVMRVTCLRDRGDTQWSTDNQTKFGYVYDSANNTLSFYAKDAIRSDNATFIPWRYTDQNSAGVLGVDVKQPNNTYVSVEPTGIVYLDVNDALTNNTYVDLNDGTVVKTTGAVIRLTNGITSSTKTPITGLFKKNDDYCAINRGYSGLNIVTATKLSTGTYQITGATTNKTGIGWKLKSPVFSGGSGIQNIVGNIVSDTGTVITIEVRQVVYTLNTTTNAITQSLGDLIDIPADSWVDIHTSLR